MFKTSHFRGTNHLSRKSFRGSARSNLKKGISYKNCLNLYLICEKMFLFNVLPLLSPLLIIYIKFYSLSTTCDIPHYVPYTNLFGFLLLGTVAADGFLLPVHQLDFENSLHAHRRPRTVYGVVIGVVKFRTQLRFCTVCGVAIGRRYRTPEAFDSEGGVEF